MIAAAPAARIRSLSAKATRWFVSNQSTLTYNIAAADEIANA